MIRQGRVLVVDDEEEWREELVEILQNNEFYVDTAATVGKALKFLNETFYHILVLDLRMSETDQNNTGGINLLHHLDNFGLNAFMKVIILSAHGTKELLSDTFKDYKIVDFVFKEDFSKQLFLRKLRQFFDGEIKINLRLAIIWQRMDNPEQSLVSMLVNSVSIKSVINMQPFIAAELDDLFCRLFYQAQSILVHPLVSARSEVGVRCIQPFHPTEHESSMIVKLDDYRTIEDEYARFKQYVEPFISSDCYTAIYSMSSTPHLSGIVYALRGSASNQPEGFGYFYQQEHVDAIKEALTQLFRHTCHAWYAHPGSLQPHNLSVEYQSLFHLTHEKLIRALMRCRIVEEKQRLLFKELNREQNFTNPITALENVQFIWSTYVCITHGDLNQYNILVDNLRNTWLINFQMTGQGHILRDIAQLDSEIRFQLLAVEEATLEERLKMEEVLCSVRHFNELSQLSNNFSTDNLALSKAYMIIVHLRLLVQQLVIQNPDHDLNEYYIALLYNALNVLLFSTLPARQREHALLSASLLVDRLGLTS